jgi:hypothetical protein
VRSVVGRARAVADVLRSDWDPIGVSGLPDDEYDSYAPGVMALVAAGAADLDVATHLSAIERDRMGLLPGAPESLLPVARKLREIVVGEALSAWLRDDLERFLGERLAEAGVWATPRESEGVRDVRIVVDGPWRARMVGEIWTIDQVVHVFWLDLEADGADRVAWRLFYDVLTSPRRARNALHIVERPEDARWRVELSGGVPR